MSYEPLDLVSRPYFDYSDRYLLHTVNTRIVRHVDSTSKKFRPEDDVLSRFHCIRVNYRFVFGDFFLPGLRVNQYKAEAHIQGAP